jgi:hypothetical protein
MLSTDGIKACHARERCLLPWLSAQLSRLGGGLTIRFRFTFRTRRKSLQGPYASCSLISDAICLRLFVGHLAVHQTRERGWATASGERYLYSIVIHARSRRHHSFCPVSYQVAQAPGALAARPLLPHETVVLDPPSPSTREDVIMVDVGHALLDIRNSFGAVFLGAMVSLP